MSKVVLVVHNVRSTHNVGSLLRTADGLGIEAVYLTGHTPYPAGPDDQRLPHIAQKTSRQIHKTALGAEHSVKWYKTDIENCLARLSSAGYELVALEQTAGATELKRYNAPEKVALIVGNEIDGLDNVVLKRVNQHLEIAMRGQKESFNVAVAAAIALYWLTTA
jgi:tRNA G18 (ribose-2'-O)-methylase SpoU